MTSIDPPGAVAGTSQPPQPVQDFMNNYESHFQRHFQSLADEVKETISKELKADPNEQEIKCQLFAQGKPKKSLEKNLVGAHGKAPFTTVGDIRKGRSIKDKSI
jgi:ppGpp synthetase/RelA/SpoT-type nucleotidyltranferase